MSIENARIECPAKPITHAFIHLSQKKYSKADQRDASME